MELGHTSTSHRPVFQIQMIKLNVQNTLVLSLLALFFVQAQTVSAEVDFSHDIVPILKKHCIACHAGSKKQGGLSFDSRQALLAGGESGKVVLAGKSSVSSLIKRVTTKDADLQMPPEGARLTAKEIDLLRKWIDEGLPWEPGFSFKNIAYEPPLKPRRPELPAVMDGRTNPLDRIIDAYLSEQKLPPSQKVFDATFLRRASLDVVGLLPEAKRLQQFLSDKSPGKRNQLIAELLSDDVAYTEHWLTFWNDLLRNDYTGTGFITGGRKQISKWLYASLLNNKPYDQMVRELIAPTAESDGFIRGIRWRGNVSASQTPEVQFSQNISQAFLGINMKCASCHDSFIDRWKLSEAYGLAAIYSTEPLEIFRCDKPTGKQAKAGWIFPELGQVDPTASQPERLKQLAELMTHPENGRLTRTIVNRIWQRLMGRGIVHPVDAMHTEPWSADLLDYLAVHLADNNYDLKKTIQLICSSHAYQSKTVLQEQEPDNGEFVFHGPLARRLTAEQFVDTVWQITKSAPTRYDAPVLRFKLSTDKAKQIQPQGKWIWSFAEASGPGPVGGAKITARKKFQLERTPGRAVAVITCDNEYTLFVNGRNVLTDGNWETVEVVDLSAHLRKGNNEFLIVAKNGGTGPNPAGLYFETRILSQSRTETDSLPMVIATDETWEWTAAAPDKRGKFKKAPTDWKPAVAVTNPGLWSSRVASQIQAFLTAGTNSPLRMVRASLVKSDFLMRSLGRPNRDQIVTSRPNGLTTLEAIDLANGQTLADAIERGASHLLVQFNNSSQELVSQIYQIALSRKPAEKELALAIGFLGENPQAETVQDFLWAIFMLPEFQLVR